jgi:hypothetical protein
MLGRHERSGLHCSSLARYLPRPGKEGGASMPSTRHEFSEPTLTQLLRALRARTSHHPDNPGLIASWPGVREDRMAAACAELLSRGHPVFQVAIASANPGRSREGWAIRPTAEEPACQA